MTETVIVGAGPVGNWVSSQTSKRDPDAEIQLYERHQTYIRSHVLRLQPLSTLLYAKHHFNPAKDPHGHAFFMRVFERSLKEIYAHAATGVSIIRTNELEDASIALSTGLGAEIKHKRIESPEEAMDLHPRCKNFIAADGANSAMRRALMGDDDVALRRTPLQHVIELKYEVTGRAGRLEGIVGYKTKKLLRNLAFEYVGREKDGKTPVTLRLFVDEETYNDVPKGDFTNPLSVNNPDLPKSVRDDIQTYMNARHSLAGEQYTPGSGKLSKLVLSNYAAKEFAVMKSGAMWSLVGDAGMGVPYFRSLNAGIIIASQLAFITTNKTLSPKQKVAAYNAGWFLNKTWEFSEANGKNFALKAFDAFRRASAAVPWEFMKWNATQANEFRTRPHPAFEAPSIIVP